MKLLTDRRHVLALAAGAIAVAGLSIAPARSATDLKWAHVYEEGSAYHQCAMWAADEIRKRTDERVNITVFPASSLGNESDINEGLTIGSVDIIYTGPNFAERDYGPIAISDYPFMLKNYDHWKAYRDSDLFKDLSAGYKDATGHTVMAITWYGYRHVTSKFPITKPYFDAQEDSPLDDFLEEAKSKPVFELIRIENQ